jgi:hypothetical protein
VLLRATQFLQPPGQGAKKEARRSAAAIDVATSPNGLVPDDGADSRSVELVISIGGEGPDCFCKSLVRVLFVNVEGLFVFSIFFEVLDVKCNSTN